MKTNISKYQEAAIKRNTILSKTLEKTLIRCQFNCKKIRNKKKNQNKQNKQKKLKMTRAYILSVWDIYKKLRNNKKF